MFGSSGCVLGVVAATCVLHPNRTIRVGGYEVPVAVWVFLALYGVAETVAAVRMGRTTIDHSGHLGGLVAGFVAAVLVRRRAGAGAVRDGDGNEVVTEEVRVGVEDRGERKGAIEVEETSAVS